MTDNQHPTKREQVVAAISVMHGPYIDAHVRALNNLPRTTAHPYVEEAEVCKIPTKFVNDLADWHLAEVEKAREDELNSVVQPQNFPIYYQYDDESWVPIDVRRAQLRQHIEERKAE